MVGDELVSHRTRCSSIQTFELVGEMSQVPSSVECKSSSRTDNGTVSPTPRREKFQRFLDRPGINMVDLRKLCWNGIPPEHRALSWLMLLGIIPIHQSRRNHVLEKRRNEYRLFSKQYFGQDTAAHLTASMKQVESQIKKDVPRTAPSLQLFKQSSVQKSMERILFLWAIRNPAAGYVQGINDLVTPFFFVFLQNCIWKREGTEVDVFSYDVSQLGEDLMKEVEADSFWCLSKILQNIQENYIFAQPGIQKMIFRLEELVQRIDSKLYNHLKREGLPFIQFAFRWMNCYLMRELPLRIIIRVFDTYVAEENGFKRFHVYFCAAFLVHFSEKLCELDFQDMILFIQHLPTDRWGEKEISALLSQSFIYQSLFEDSPSHLK